MPGELKTTIIPEIYISGPGHRPESIRPENLKCDLYKCQDMIIRIRAFKYLINHSAVSAAQQVFFTEKLALHIFCFFWMRLGNF